MGDGSQGDRGIPLLEAAHLLCAFVARRPLLFVGAVVVVGLVPLAAYSIVRANLDPGDPQAWPRVNPLLNALQGTSVGLWLAAVSFLLLAAVRAIARAARSKRAGQRLRELDVQAGRAAIRLDEHARAAETVLGRAHAVLPGQPELGVAIAALPLGLLNLLVAWSALGYAAECPVPDCTHATAEGVVSAAFAGLLLGLAVLAAWSWASLRKDRVGAIRWVAALEERVQRGEAPPPEAAPAAPRGPRVEVIRTSATRGAASASDLSRRQP
jgi:hypothetical protein